MTSHPKEEMPKLTEIEEALNPYQIETCPECGYSPHGCICDRKGEFEDCDAD